MSENKLVDIEVLKKCPLCASGNLKLFCQGYDRLHQISMQEFEYATCQNCGLVFLSKRPFEKDIHFFYPTDYGPYHGLNYLDTETQGKTSRKNLVKKGLFLLSKMINPIVNTLFKNDFDKKYQALYTPISKGQTLLDFGCGSDKFLKIAKSNGWNPVGMDFTAQGLEMAKQSGIKTILFDNWEAWNQLEDNSIDFVRMNHVLEHLFNPKEILQMLKQKLKKGGMIHIAVPNPGGISALIFKQYWRGLECPRHIMLYTPNVLKIFLSNLGFSKIQILNEVITKDFARSGGFKKYEKGMILHNEIEKRADDTQLSSILYLPARIAALINQADRFHLFASK